MKVGAITRAMLMNKVREKELAYWSLQMGRSRQENGRRGN
jgi:hypothetical protein